MFRGFVEPVTSALPVSPAKGGTLCQPIRSRFSARAKKEGGAGNLARIRPDIG